MDLVSESDAENECVAQPAEVSPVGGSVGPVVDDEASGEESESLSPPVVDGPYFDSPHAKRQKLDHLLKHSVPAADVGQRMTNASSSGSASMSMLQRARVFEDRSLPLSSPSSSSMSAVPSSDSACDDLSTSEVFPATKWGRCPQCQYALRPHLFMAGRFSGQVRKLCSRFWVQVEGRRQCFSSVPLSTGDWDKVPRFLKQKHSELPAVMRRNGGRVQE